MSKIILSDRVAFEYGYGVRVDNEEVGPFPVFGSNGVTGYISTYRVDGPGVIIGRKGSVGKVSYSENNFTPTDTAYYLNILDQSKDDMKYWFYYLQLLGLDNLNTHSSVPGLSRDTVHFINVNPPDLIVQQEISQVLSKIETNINLNKTIINELENILRTIYNYWFVQFNFPNGNSKPYKSFGGKLIYNEGLKREIPRGWQVEAVGKILRTSLGGTPATKNNCYWENGDIPWLNSGELVECPITGSEEFITQEGLGNSAAELLPKGSVVISIVRYIRPSILAIDACFNQSVVGIFESNTLKNSYIFPFLINEVPRLMSIRTGAQQPHINKEAIDGTLMLIPDEKILTEFNKLTKPIIDSIVNTALENQQLILFRDWLLPLLMNGQVRVD